MTHYFRRFITALTRGGPGGLPRPIEVHAHDPLHYVGDTLGWLHRAFASERELVLVLLDPDVVVEWSLPLFEVRVKQVLQSQPNIMISYKLSNTLEFYSQPYCELNDDPLMDELVISDLLGRETALSNTLWALKDAAQKTLEGRSFYDILPLFVAVDPSPPPAVREGVLMLLEIIEIKHNSMMITASGKNPIFDPVISALIDCIIQMCEQAAEAHMSKGAIHSSRRSRTSSDLNKSSVDAIFKNSSSLATSQDFVGQSHLGYPGTPVRAQPSY
ncbi:hypothetical protein HYC85_022691 [Camellia sinensis]|uniref:Conserved Oligomeric Golgi complex subunit 6 C-terminal domain-containing protein n=1 Tax=Camellia sinensis TaxID=4442 RepID=A0A7J7GCH2_CAMSI|nr:hypothetical protein HYC85_022691 [Camellia sinensis]